MTEVPRDARTGAGAGGRALRDRVAAFAGAEERAREGEEQSRGEQTSKAAHRGAMISLARAAWSGGFHRRTEVRK